MVERSGTSALRANDQEIGQEPDRVAHCSIEFLDQWSRAIPLNLLFKKSGRLQALLYRKRDVERLQSLAVINKRRHLRRNVAPGRRANG